MFVLVNSWRICIDTLKQSAAPLRVVRVLLREKGEKRANAFR